MSNPPSSGRAGDRSRLAAERVPAQQPPAGANDPVTEHVLAAVASLKAADREALLLVHWEQLSYAEAVQVLGGVAVTIRPSAIPHGIGLYLKAWAAGPSANNGLSLQIDLVQATPQCTG